MKKILLYLFFFSFLSVKAQKTEIRFHFLNNQELPKSIKAKTEFKNLEKAEKSLFYLLKKIQLKGFIESSIDSTVLKQNILHTYIYS